MCSNMHLHIYGGPLVTKHCIHVFDGNPDVCVKWKFECKLTVNKVLKWHVKPNKKANKVKLISKSCGQVVLLLNIGNSFYLEQILEIKSKKVEEICSTFLQGFVKNLAQDYTKLRYIWYFA